MRENIVIVTGGFDPIHSGHIDYINSAAKLGKVVVGLNSDSWLTNKKGKPFMPFDERYAVLSNLKNVEMVIDYDDSDGSSCEAISKVKLLYPDNNIIFANGGDRTLTNIPELEKFKNDQQISFKFGIGGENKKNSSSWILNEWKHPSEKRNWGSFLTYYDSTKSKVKRLVIDPGKSISMQYHKNRSELWFVESGNGIVSKIGADGTEFELKKLSLHDYHLVSINTWHKLTNNSTEPLFIIEIQYGTCCEETDIIRQ